jgi:hypothetical protein
MANLTKNLQSLGLETCVITGFAFIDFINQQTIKLC